jgi:hypothetical protein
VTITLKEAEATLEPKDAGALKTKQKISEGIEPLNYRQKLGKMADSSSHVLFLSYSVMTWVLCCY